jgi:uncharacterized membrane protein
LNEFFSNAAIAGIPGKAVVLGIVLHYVWLLFLLLRFDIDEDYLGPGKVHV